MRRTDKRLPIFNRISLESSRATTRAYSTSFSLSIRTLSPEIRDAIYAIYGFVRLADEIVDSFHGYDQRTLLDRFKEDTYRALDEQISLNPILQAFQVTYHRYGIARSHVDHFLQSMEWDLDRTVYDRADFDTYVVGSAEVVGLMCLKVFVRGDQKRYDELEPPAVRLGAAFQKINFLRDLREDVLELGRSYFPDIEMESFDDETKRRIEEEIEKDFDAALVGIRLLPKDARFGVYLAYRFYRKLLGQIVKLSSETVMETRIRVSGFQKLMLLISVYGRHRLNLV